MTPITQSQWPEIYIALLTTPTRWDSTSPLPAQWPVVSEQFALAEKIRPRTGSRDTVDAAVIAALTPQEWSLMYDAMKRRIENIKEWTAPVALAQILVTLKDRATLEARYQAEFREVVADTTQHNRLVIFQWREEGDDGDTVEECFIPAGEPHPEFAKRVISDGDVITTSGRHFRINISEVPGMCAKHPEIRCEFDPSGSVTCPKCLAEGSDRF